MLVFSPTPSASVSTATVVKPGCLISDRNARESGEFIRETAQTRSKACPVPAGIGVPAKTRRVDSATVGPWGPSMDGKGASRIRDDGTFVGGVQGDPLGES